MKLVLGQQVVRMMHPDEVAQLKRVVCGCGGQLDCEGCEGTDVVYEVPMTAEEEAAIEENLRSQGVPLGKGSTN